VACVDSEIGSQYDFDRGRSITRFTECREGSIRRGREGEGDIEGKGDEDQFGGKRETEENSPETPNHVVHPTNLHLGVPGDAVGRIPILDHRACLSSPYLQHPFLLTNFSLSRFLEMAWSRPQALPGHHRTASTGPTGAQTCPRYSPSSRESCEPHVGRRF
jgi:hypothetical protein